MSYKLHNHIAHFLNYLFVSSRSTVYIEVDLSTENVSRGKKFFNQFSEFVLYSY